MQLLRRVQRGAFASHVLAQGLSGLSQQERSFATDLLYGVLRHHRYLDAALQPYLKRPEKLPEDVRNALRLAAYELLIRDAPRAQVTNAWVALLKGRYGNLSGLVNAVLRRLEPPSEVPPAVRFSVPDFLFGDWQELLGEADAARAASGMNAPEPLWLTRYHADAEAVLEQDGATLTPGPLPGTLAARLGKPLGETEAFKRGYVQPQNPASTVPVLALEPAPGAYVLDLASGHGVKTAHLSARGCEVLSVEVSPGKAKRAEANLERLGLRAQYLTHDLRTPPDVPAAPFVLLDAPCSGTGTLRGHPEIRLRLTPAVVAELAALQAELLRSAAQLTAPGGLLVYAVCALTRAETTWQVRAFLAAQPEFSLLPYQPPLPGPVVPEGAFILPEDGLDGFFIARFRRASP